MWKRDMSWRYKPGSSYGCKAWDKMRLPSEKKSKTYRNSEIPLWEGNAEEEKSTKEAGLALSKNPKENLQQYAIQKPREDHDSRWDGVRKSASLGRLQKSWKANLKKRLLSSKEKLSRNSQLSSISVSWSNGLDLLLKQKLNQNNTNQNVRSWRE